MIKHRLSLLILALVFTLSGVFSLIIPSLDNASALSGSQFKAGNIMSNGVFFHSQAMSNKQILKFLNAKLPSCDTWGEKPYAGTTRKKYAASKGVSTPFVCLKNYTQKTPSRTANTYCKSYPGGHFRASRIIYEVGKACGVSQKVLLILLQKEQSLVTDDWPWPIQYRSATGYGCPDTASCDPKYYGFFEQVYRAAWIYKIYAETDGPNYRKNQNNNIRWHPNSSCGSSTVFIENQATAGLYNYTPYRPNKAALNNLYGKGDSCSSYGNRNFWRMYNDWFGSTQVEKVNIYTNKYDVTTDKTGEQAKIGFRLSKKPKHKVRIYTGISSPSNAEIRGSSVVTILPKNWNSPRKNTVTVIGLNNPDLVGTFENKLSVSNISSADARFNAVKASSISDIRLAQLDTSNPPNVYRVFNEDTRQHYFTASKKERDAKISDGWRNEGGRFYYCQGGENAVYRLSKAGETRLVEKGSAEHHQFIKDGFILDSANFAISNQGGTPIYWLFDSIENRSLYSDDPNEGSASGFVNQGVAFYSCGADYKPVYRMFKRSTSNHFYTTSPQERDKAIYSLGYKYEHLGFYTCENSTIEVYRLFKRVTGNHFYTTSPQERDKAINVNGYEANGVRFKLCNDANTNVYRLFKRVTGNHFYTTSPQERDKAINVNGYEANGVRFKSE